MAIGDKKWSESQKAIIYLIQLDCNIQQSKPILVRIY